MIVTSRNNHHKAYEVSGKGELLHDRQIGIILEMVTALKTKFMLRKKIPHDLFHRQHFQTTPAGAPESTSKSTLLTKLLTTKRVMAGAGLAACSMEAQNQGIGQLG